MPAQSAGAVHFDIASDDEEDQQHLLRIALTLAKQDVLSLSVHIAANRSSFSRVLAENRQIAEQDAQELRARLLQENNDHI